MKTMTLDTLKRAAKLANCLDDINDMLVLASASKRGATERDYRIEVSIGEKEDNGDGSSEAWVILDLIDGIDALEGLKKSFVVQLEILGVDMKSGDS